MKDWKKVLSWLSNLLLILVVGFLIYSRAPMMLEQYKAEGRKADSFQVDLLSGSKFESSLHNKPVVLVFWATWCGPCEVELSRLQKMIDKGEISASDVLAISYEDSDLLTKVAREKGFTFEIGSDPSNKAAALFKVTATPTVVLLKKDSEIAWITTGLSPSLELRVKNFLKPIN